MEWIAAAARDWLGMERSVENRNGAAAEEWRDEDLECRARHRNGGSAGDRNGSRG